MRISALGLRMHLAPRRLMILGVVSSKNMPLRSVLPGFIDAAAFTKVYLRRPMGSLVDEHSGLERSLYIDDSG